MKSAIKRKGKKKERERERAPQTISCSLFFGCDRTGAGLRDQARNAEILQQYLGRVVELFIDRKSGVEGKVVRVGGT